MQFNTYAFKNKRSFLFNKQSKADRQWQLINTSDLFISEFKYKLHRSTMNIQ